MFKTIIAFLPLRRRNFQLKALAILLLLTIIFLWARHNDINSEPPSIQFKRPPKNYQKADEPFADYRHEEDAIEAANVVDNDIESIRKRAEHKIWMSF